MGLGIASVFIVGGSIVPAFADAASRNIPIPNVEYTTEDRDGSFKLKVNEDCSLSPVDNTTQVDGDTVKMFLGKKPTDADRPNTDKPSVDKPNTDNPNAGANTDKPADKPSIDKPVDKPSVDNNKPASKVDTNKPVANNADNKIDASKVKVERPAVANANTPKTSDNSNIALYSMLLIGSIGAISVIFRRKLRTNK